MHMIVAKDLVLNILTGRVGEVWRVTPEWVLVEYAHGELQREKREVLKSVEEGK